MYAFEYVFGYKLILKSIPEPDFDLFVEPSGSVTSEFVHLSHMVKIILF